MKKALSAIGIIALSVTMLTACGRRNDDTAVTETTPQTTSSVTTVTTTETTEQFSDYDGDGFVEDVITDAEDTVEDVVTGAEDIVEEVLPGDSNGNGR